MAPTLNKHSEDVGIMAEAKDLLADIAEVWWSAATANYIRAGKLSVWDIITAFLIGLAVVL